MTEKRERKLATWMELATDSVTVCNIFPHKIRFKYMVLQLCLCYCRDFKAPSDWEGGLAPFHIHCDPIHCCFSHLGRKVSGVYRAQPVPMTYLTSTDGTPSSASLLRPKHPKSRYYYSVRSVPVTLDLRLRVHLNLFKAQDEGLLTAATLSAGKKSRQINRCSSQTGR